jgi:predicted dehydrogenase
MNEARTKHGAEPAASWEDGLGDRPDGVLVCTPPSSHVALARRALEAGAHVFVEKPLANDTAEVPALLDLAERSDRVLAVGFNLRFLPSLRRVKALIDSGRVGKIFAARAAFGFYLPEWRPGRDYRDNYATRSAEGGGVLLDLIHEFDYLGWMFGEAAEVFCTAGHLSPLAGDTEDLAEVTVRFACGVLAQVHLDYLRRAYRRDLEIIGDTGVITWDYRTRAVQVLGPAPDQVEAQDGSTDAANETMYVEEIRHFVRCMEGSERSLVDGREALRSLRMVEAAKQSASEGRWVKL